MRFRAVVALSVLAAIGVMAMACEDFVEFRVVNNTNEPLKTWLFYDDCVALIGEFGQYDYATEIRPHSSEDIFDARGTKPHEPSCVQGVDAKRRLVLSETYEYGQTYIVNDTSQPGIFIPLEDDLPGERPNERPFILRLAIGLAILGTLALGAYVLARLLGSWRRRRHTATQ